MFTLAGGINGKKYINNIRKATQAGSLKSSGNMKDM
jgi:hypothetical protein